MPHSQSPVPMRLKEARQKSGLSQKELGIKAGIDEFTASPRINQYEAGKHTPSYLTLVQLAEVLEVPVPFFYCADDMLARLMLQYSRMAPDEQSLFVAILENGCIDMKKLTLDASLLLW